MIFHRTRLGCTVNDWIVPDRVTHNDILRDLPFAVLELVDWSVRKEQEQLLAQVLTKECIWLKNLVEDPDAVEEDELSIEELKNKTREIARLWTEVLLDRRGDSAVARLFSRWRLFEASFVVEWAGEEGYSVGTLIECQAVIEAIYELIKQ